MVVAGAAGGVGEEIVRALLARVHDARVLAISRHPARLERLAARLDGLDLGRFIPIVADVSDMRGAHAALALVEAAGGGVDVAIPSLGGWWEGKLLDVDEATYDRVMTEMFRAHFHFARAFVPAMLHRPGALYLGIGGGAALYPVPDAGLVSIAGAAQLMLTRVLAAETKDAAVTVRELVVNGPVSTRDVPGPPDWITANEIGEVVADIVMHGETSWPKQRERGPLLLMDVVRPHS
ncbi:MAG TPA: SDR family oxidoreductase [Candidatus Baltobacteraceae bacterium]|nr:SDR family oxidoreductase [Candidatus Baltobacteraceae bacterium]